MKNLNKPEVYTPRTENEWWEIITGLNDPERGGSNEPIFEYCSSCKGVRTKGRCFNKECKYYDKTS